MAYTVAYCDDFMDELLDKMGSDYFPLPIKLKRFESITLQFIRETTTFMEVTQEISDDIVPWVVSERKSLSAGKTAQYMGKQFFKIEYPDNYQRLISVIPLIENNGIFTKLDREIHLYRVGEYLKNERNPFRTANNDRINIYRMDDAALIDTNYDGDPPMQYAAFSYVRTPVFGSAPTDMMLDTKSKVVLDKLMHKTCVSLRATTSDVDTGLLDELTERQGQKIK